MSKSLENNNFFTKNHFFLFFMPSKTRKSSILVCRMHTNFLRYLHNKSADEKKYYGKLLSSHLVFQEVKSGRIVVTSPKDFASHASKQVESVTTLYLPTKEILPEPMSVSDAPYIKGTLDVHRIIRRKNIQGVMYLEFYRLSSDEVPFFTQYYRNDDDPIVCGHQSFNDGLNKCANCFSVYHQCPVCKQWYCSEPCFSV